MMSFAFEGIELGATLLEVYLGFRINAVLLTDKMRKPHVFLWATFLLTMVIQIMNQYRLFSVFTSVAAVAGCTIGTILICQSDFLGSLISSVLYVILIHIIDFLSLSVWSLVFTDSQFGIRIISGYSMYRVIHIVFCKVVLLAVWYFFFRRLTGRAAVPVKKMAMAAAGAVGLVWYLGRATFEDSEAVLTVVWGILLFVILIGIYFFREYGRWKESQMEYELAVQKNEWIAKSYRQNQLFYHNLNNHYVIIKGFLQKKEYEKAEEYMEQIGATKQVSLRSWVGDDTLDILLNQKLEAAQNESINMEILPDKIQLRLTGEELTSLFGNALDNAIEACRRVEREKRWIRFQIKRVNDMSFFKISNGIPNDFDDQEGEGRTTKEHKSRHGLGILSMKLIAEKYGGVVETKVDDGKFVLMISFFE